MPGMRQPIVLCLLSLFTLGCTEEAPALRAIPRDGGALEDAPRRDASASDDLSTDRDPISEHDLDAGREDPEPSPPTDVAVAITSDNAFSFGYGSEDSLATFIQGVASEAREIFDCPVGYGPKTFVVPGEQAPEDAFLYIVSWADRFFTQGTLAQFKRANSDAIIYSGDDAWQVCATGVEYDISATTGPDQAMVERYLRECNRGVEGTTFSRGWVDTAGAATPGARGKLALGEANDDPRGEFPLVCQQDDRGMRGIDAEARWMWFDPEDGASAFRGNAENRTQTFLIFRLPALILL